MKRKQRASKPSRPAAHRARGARVAKPPAKKKRPKIVHAPSVRESLERELRRLRSARSKLERRLTAAVQEIGTLRQFELRATMLEAELQKSEQELAHLRRETDQRIRDLESNLGAASAPTPA